MLDHLLVGATQEPSKGIRRGSLRQLWERITVKLVSQSNAGISRAAFDRQPQSLAEAQPDQALEGLVRMICKHYRFDSETYPELGGATAETRLAFAVRHSALHFAKTTGQIAAVSEAVDHGRDMDLEELRGIVPKALISVLRLAELIQLSERDLVKAIEAKYNDRISLT